MKGAGFRMVGEVTKLNTGLIGRLLIHPKIDSAWYFNGAVYGKTSEGRRYKFDTYCNIDTVIRGDGIWSYGAIILGFSTIKVTDSDKR